MAAIEHELRFFTADDGVRIAYTVLGTGPVLVNAGAWWGGIESNTDARWQGRATNRRGQRLAQALYDTRGVGHSQRACGEIMLERCVDDLAQFVEHLSPEQYVLRGSFSSALVAAAFASRRPPGLERLLLVQPFARGSDITTAEAARGQMEMIRGNWPLAARGMTGITTSGTEQRDLARLWVKNMSPDVAASYIALQSFADVTNELARIDVPTLVIHQQRNRLSSAAAAIEVASLVPGARYIAADGIEEEDDALFAFLGIEPPPRQEVARDDSVSAVILFADIASSTALTERMGDAAFRERSRALDAAIRDAVRAAGGTPVEGKVMGDGVMSTFASARQAIDAALRCRAAAEAAGLPLHLGIHAGDVIREGENVYGGAVNIAARVCDASEPGEILVSDIVRGLARTSAGVTFEDRGERALKGIDEPVRVWAVRA